MQLFRHSACSACRVSEQLLQPSKPKQFRAAMVEKILDWRKGQSDDGVGEELYVKMKGEPHVQQDSFLSSCLPQMLTYEVSCEITITA